MCRWWDLPASLVLVRSLPLPNTRRFRQKVARRPSPRATARGRSTSRRSRRSPSSSVRRRRRRPRRMTKCMTSRCERSTSTFREGSTLPHGRLHCTSVRVRVDARSSIRTAFLLRVYRRPRTRPMRQMFRRCDVIRGACHDAAIGCLIEAHGLCACAPPCPGQ